MHKYYLCFLLIALSFLFVSCETVKNTIVFPYNTEGFSDTTTDPGNTDTDTQTPPATTGVKTDNTYTTEPTGSPTPTPTPSATSITTPPTTDIVYRDYDFSSVSLKSSSAAVYDMYDDRFVYLKNCDESARIYPASMTKLYMIHVGMDFLPLDEVITAGDEISLVNPHSSFAHISKGDRLTVRMIIEGMLLPSGNDAAYVFATAAGYKILGDRTANVKTAINTFIDKVNDYARSEGLNGSHFVTPDGLHDDDHYTTVEDLFKIARMALENEVVAGYMSLQRDTVTYESGRVETWTNRNLMLDPSSQYYCPEIIGLKTGHTTQAGYCLVSAAEYNGRKIIMLVMGSSYQYDRFADTQKLVAKFKEY